MRKIDYGIPIFEDDDIADLENYSTLVAKVLKEQIGDINTLIDTIQGEVI